MAWLPWISLGRADFSTPGFGKWNVQNEIKILGANPEAFEKTDASSFLWEQA
jgi:hypothetical protein